MNKERLRIALRIIASLDDLSVDMYNEIGCDIYKFGYYDKPSRDDLVEKAIEIVIEEIDSVIGKEEDGE